MMDPIKNEMVPFDSQDLDATIRSLQDEVDRKYPKGTKRDNARAIAGTTLTYGEIVEVKGVEFRVGRVDAKKIILRPHFKV